MKDLYVRNEQKLAHLSDSDKLDKMVELNVARSVDSVAHSTIVQNAWGRGQKLAVHGWCYRLTDGKINDLQIKVEGLNDLKGVHRVVKHPEYDLP